MVESLGKDSFSGKSVNLVIKDSDKNTKCIETSDHEKIAKHRHVRKLVVDRAVSTMDHFFGSQIREKLPWVPEPPFI